MVSIVSIDKEVEAFKYAVKHGWCVHRQVDGGSTHIAERWLVYNEFKNPRTAEASTLHEAVEKLKAILIPTITKDEIVDRILQAISEMRVNDGALRTLNDTVNKIRNSKVVE